MRLAVEGLVAGYGDTEVLHGVDLQLGAGESLCLVGPNGAGKSTVLNAVYGFADIHRGRILVEGRDITRLPPQGKLKEAGVAFVLQESSIFPDLSVEHNLRLGGYLMQSSAQAARATERILERHAALAARRHEPARVLSGGERRILEISRAMMMDPRLLLVDEPSIGLEPRAIDTVFAMLGELQREGKSILVVEQNVRKGLEFADLGCVLVSGRVQLTGSGLSLLDDRRVGGFFLGS